MQNRPAHQSSFGQGGLKGGEIRSAILIQRTYLAIDDRVRKIACRPCDRGILGGPVQSLARLQCRVAVEYAHLDAISVKLDFVQPSAARWGPRQSVAELRGDEFW